MFQTIDQIQLEQIILVSIMTEGLEAYANLPKNFRATVFSVGSHQRIFKLIELIVKKKLPLEVVTVAKHADQKLAREIALILGTVQISSYFVDGRLNEAALELIRRAETPFEVREGDEEVYSKNKNETFLLIEDELLNGNYVKIMGFGVFYVKVRRGYTRFSGILKRTVKVSNRVVIKFYQFKRLNDYKNHMESYFFRIQELNFRGNMQNTIMKIIELRSELKKIHSSQSGLWYLQQASSQQKMTSNYAYFP